MCPAGATAEACPPNPRRGVSAAQHLASPSSPPGGGCQGAGTGRPFPGWVGEGGGHHQGSQPGKERQSPHPRARLEAAGSSPQVQDTTVSGRIAPKQGRREGEGEGEGVGSAGQAAAPGWASCAAGASSVRERLRTPVGRVACGAERAPTLRQIKRGRRPASLSGAAKKGEPPGAPSRPATFVAGKELSPAAAHFSRALKSCSLPGWSWKCSWGLALSSGLQG